MEDDSSDHYNAFTSPTGNIIWAAAMQLAWNQLRESITHNQPLSLLTQKPFSLKSIRNFNEGRFKKNDISAKSIYVKCGYGQETVDTINKQVKQKFPEKTFPPLNYKLSKLDIISYAYLFKKLTFTTKFQRRNENNFIFNNQSVPSFYAKNEMQKKQVIVDRYEDLNNFIVHITDKSEVDCLYLIKSSTNLTVDQAIARTVEASNKKGVGLGKNDKFQMPVLSIDEQRSYEQLVGLPFGNAELKEYFIRVMKEKIKLQVNQSGAKVENQAVMVMPRCCAVVQTDVKRIILDRDFWIVMKQAKGHPYLCMLVRQIK